MVQAKEKALSPLRSKKLERQNSLKDESEEEIFKSSQSKRRNSL